MAKGLASTGDTAEKKLSIDGIGKGLYAFTAEGDPNSGAIVGDDGAPARAQMLVGPSIPRT